jgi:hypothetical protein
VESGFYPRPGPAIAPSRGLFLPRDHAVTAHKSEAECLLESGGLYGRRLLVRPDTGEPVFVGFKPGAFSSYHGDAPIYHFDLEGRWQRAYLEDRHYLKGLDNNVQTIDRVREGENLVLKRRTLSPEAAGAIDARVRSTAVRLRDSLRGGLPSDAPPSRGRPVDTEELDAFLERVVGWDESAWANHAQKYRETYGPWPFIPPDCPGPVVLQATVAPESGHSFGGGFTAPESVRPPAELERHARAVAALLGRRIDQCKTAFLGGAEVLRRPSDDVTSYLKIIARVFPIEPEPGHRHPDPAGDSPARLNGVHAFLDDFAPELPDRQGWARLAALGLRRVGLGVESGDEGVRELYGKAWQNQAIRDVVTELKASGLGVGVVVLVGAGGVAHADGHLERTLELIYSLNLGRGDTVSLIDANELAGSAPDPLTGALLAGQLLALKQRLVPLREAHQVKVVPYSLEKQGLS